MLDTNSLDGAQIKAVMLQSLHEHFHAHKAVLYLGHSVLHFIDFIHEFYTQIIIFVQNHHHIHF